MARQSKHERLVPYIDKLVRGETLRPDHADDRQELARTVDFIRSEKLIPVLTLKLDDGVIGYRMAETDIREYHENRPAQKNRQRIIITHASRVRDAKRCQRLFSEMGLELPAEIVALLAHDKRTRTPDDIAG